MDNVLKAGRFEMTIGGVKFVSRRRTTAIMAAVHGFLATMGQLESRPSSDDVEIKAGEHAKTCEACMRAALIEPVIAPIGEPTIDGVQYAYADLEFAADVWIVAFMESAVTADPTPPSCEA